MPTYRSKKVRITPIPGLSTLTVMGDNLLFRAAILRHYREFTQVEAGLAEPSNALFHLRWESRTATVAFCAATAGCMEVPSLAVQLDSHPKGQPNASEVQGCGQNCDRPYTFANQMVLRYESRLIGNVHEHGDSIRGPGWFRASARHPALHRSALLSEHRSLVENEDAIFRGQEVKKGSTNCWSRCSKRRARPADS